jgi:glycosyltransferase involved in cell wall biosynthesis
MTSSRLPISRLLYHHRTQGKAVEGVHIRGLVDGLRELGVEVDLVSLPGADPYAAPKAMSPTAQATGLMRTVSRLPEPLFEAAELAYNLLAGLRLLAQLRRQPVQAIYERYSLFLFVGVLIARIARVPLVLEINDAAFVERVRPLYFRRLALAIERWTFRNCTGLVFVSGAFRARAEATHGRIAPAIVAPNAADLRKFTFTPEQREQTRSRLGLQDSVVCGYLGAFVPWHRIDLFIEKVAAHLDERPDLKFLLVGDGSTFPKVREFVESRAIGHRIVLAGRVGHDEVPSLLAAMDMAILPSAGDYTSPVKLFEFMACGIPPVAPDFEPIREVLREGETGWMFKAGDMDAAVEATLLHANKPAELREVGARARAYVARERQWRNNAQQLLDFYADLSHARPPMGS